MSMEFISFFYVRMRSKTKLFTLNIILQLLILSCTTLQPGMTREYSEPVFRKPESVVLDRTNQCLYVSNINGSPTKRDGNGFISKISTSGEVISLEWITGLDAPKGMFLRESILYCTDISNVLLIDIAKGLILETIEIPEAKFLNDIVVTDDGLLLVTDTTEDTIFILDAGTVRKSEQRLKNANGIFYDGEIVLIGANGDINVYSPDGDSLEVLHENVGNVDGLFKSREEILFSNFFNKLSRIEDGIAINIDKGMFFLDCKADFCRLEDGTIVVPDFDSRLIFYVLNEEL